MVSIRQRISPQFIRFLAVGVLNTAVGYGLFALLVWTGLAYPLAIAISTCAGVAFNFQTTGRLVFGNSQWRRIIRFIAVYGVAYGVNVAAIAGLLKLGVNVYLATALLLLPIALLTYTLQKNFVFKSP